jgi:hypothetical protein
VGAAILAGVLFGLGHATTKLLIGGMGPIELAGFSTWVRGSDCCSSLVRRAFRRAASNRRQASTGNVTRRSDVGWLAGAVAFSGVLGPLL